ncbi:MAG: TetR/AcrR family transcriptional regulator [Proteobacteria bacterium]|nr:TetR/AcrR family transcriptional regulator [Pseudomonadota bacterium]
MAAPVPSPSPRAQRTRAALLDAGLDLLADRPIDAVAIDEVVARAGVAKGSFFNHFADKQAFADAISAVVRGEIELRVEAVNRDLPDPLERLAGGMIAAAVFAQAQPRRAAVLLRATSRMTPRDHPINRGLRADLDCAVAAGQIDRASTEDGVLFWLTCCQAVLGEVADRALPPKATLRLVSAMLHLGLRGLGASAADLARIAAPEHLSARFAACTL